jgi:hypothetical protein
MDVEGERESYPRVIASQREQALAGAPALVPALVARTLSPAAGILALASMPPKDRLIASLTPRVAFLRSLLAVLDAGKGTSGDERYDALVMRMARRVPDAMETRRSLSESRIKSAVQRELDQLFDADEAERMAAASRLEGLSLENSLYGPA